MKQKTPFDTTELDKKFDEIIKVRKQLEECPIKEKVLKQALYLELCQLQKDYGHESFLEIRLKERQRLKAEVEKIIDDCRVVANTKRIEVFPEGGVKSPAPISNKRGALIYAQELKQKLGMTK